jgi:hypothetical protein
MLVLNCFDSIRILTESSWVVTYIPGIQNGVDEVIRLGRKEGLRMAHEHRDIDRLPVTKREGQFGNSITTRDTKEVELKSFVAPTWTVTR